jgi:hypothetical protein
MRQLWIGGIFFLLGLLGSGVVRGDIEKIPLRQNLKVQTILNTYFHIDLPTKKFSDLADLTQFFRKHSRQLSRTRNLKYGEFSFRKGSRNFLWFFSTRTPSQGSFAIIDADLNVLFLNENLHEFVRVQVGDLFQVGEQNLTMTSRISKGGSSWEIAEVFRFEPPRRVRLIYTYSPRGQTSLGSAVGDTDSLSHEGQVAWAKGTLFCESRLEWRKKTKLHSPDLTLWVKTVLDLKLKGLGPDSIKELNSFSQKKLGLALGQSSEVALDRLSLDEDDDDSDFSVSYGTLYGDDLPFGKSPCPAGWSHPSNPPQLIYR